MAEILTFPAKASSKPRKSSASFRMRTWAEQHIQLIDAAIDLGKASDADFRKRCQVIAETEGQSVLTKMAAQLDRLSTHIAGIVTTLSLTSRRIRKLTAEGTFA